MEKNKFNPHANDSLTLNVDKGSSVSNPSADCLITEPSSSTLTGQQPIKISSNHEQAAAIEPLKLTDPPASTQLIANSDINANLSDENKALDDHSQLDGTTPIEASNNTGSNNATIEDILNIQQEPTVAKPQPSSLGSDNSENATDAIVPAVASVSTVFADKNYQPKTSTKATKIADLFKLIALGFILTMAALFIFSLSNDISEPTETAVAQPSSIITPVNQTDSDKSSAVSQETADSSSSSNSTDATLSSNEDSSENTPTANEQTTEASAHSNTPDPEQILNAPVPEDEALLKEEIDRLNDQDQQLLEQEQILDKQIQIMDELTTKKQEQIELLEKQIAQLEEQAKLKGN